MSEKGTKIREKRQKHSWLLKRQAIIAYRTGRYSHAELAELFGVTAKIVGHWIYRYGSHVGTGEDGIFSVMTDEERKDFEELKRQNESLKQQLDYAQMKAQAMEIIVDLAKSEYGIDLRKNSGARQPASLKKTTRGQK